MSIENLKRKTGLKRKQIELLALIYSLSKLKGCCLASKRDMARWLNLSETDIYNQLKALQEMGFIQKIKPYKSGKIYIDQKALESFCLYKSSELVGLNEAHLYINMPYWIFSLADIDPEEYINFCEKLKNKNADEAEINDVPEWIMDLCVD